MASHQPKAEILERWKQLYATWNIGWSEIRFQRQLQGTCTMKYKNKLPPRIFPSSPSSFHSLSYLWKVYHEKCWSEALSVTDAQREDPIQQFPSPHTPGSSQQCCYLTQKKNKLFDFHTCTCVALSLITMCAFSQLGKPSPWQLYALLCCPGGLVRLSGHSLMSLTGRSLWHEAGSGLLRVLQAQESFQIKFSPLFYAIPVFQC